jgi:hypothetical protein
MAKGRPKAKATQSTAAGPARGTGARLVPPAGGAAVRFYRVGHGDCFLIAFDNAATGKPAHVLIDFGYKPGSPGKFIARLAPDAEKEVVKAATDRHINEIAADIAEATGGHIDVAIITHEHQDHVNAISAKRFEGVTIGEAWFAWTEDPTDDLANDLRRKHKDKLLQLAALRLRMAADSASAKLIDAILGYELGGEEEDGAASPAASLLGAAPKDPLRSLNKKAMKVFKDKAGSNIRFVQPHEGPIPLPGAPHVLAYPLGPPKSEKLIMSMDPQGDEEFHLAPARRSLSDWLGAAAGTAIPAEALPFDARYGAAWTKETALADIGLAYPPDPAAQPRRDAGGRPAKALREAELEAPWRRIDDEWLLSAEQLALAMDEETNNLSLVLAFEIERGGKVLLFVGDAQRGNWLSWADKDFAVPGPDGGTRPQTVKELLSRAVLYKVGHHGSHNATLDGGSDSGHPSLGWIGSSPKVQEFTAMITAVEAWAKTQDGWNHPLPSIRKALVKKAEGRVFQTDVALADMPARNAMSDDVWRRLTVGEPPQASGTDLYFDVRFAP